MKTIIVRVFEPAAEAGPAALHGVVEDVRTGSTDRFRGHEQLLAAIARVLARRVEPPANSPDQSRWS